MVGNFPQLSSYLEPRKRYQNPQLQQVMPQQPTMADNFYGQMGQQPQGGMMGAVRGMMKQGIGGYLSGQAKQKAFNQQQQDANRGMIGGMMNRRRF